MVPAAGPDRAREFEAVGRERRSWWGGGGVGREREGGRERGREKRSKGGSKERRIEPNL